MTEDGKKSIFFMILLLLGGVRLATGSIVQEVPLFYHISIAGIKYLTSYFIDDCSTRGGIDI